MKSEQLRVTETNELLEAFITNTPFAVVVIDLSGKVKTANKLVKKYLNLNVAHEKLVEANFLKSIEHIPELANVLASSLEEGTKPFSIESLVLNERYFAVSGQLILDGYIVTIEDITKQKEIEANSIQSILEGQENERRRLGREIHDGIGPMLSYMKLSLDSFIDELHHQNPNVKTDILDNIAETIDSITSDLRSLTHSLVPRLLDEFGLNSAFKNLIFKLNESKKLTIKYYTNSKNEARLDKDIELNIFRCGQELLNNAVKYAKANNILVQVIMHGESVVLMVEDDGIGFERSKLLLENFGIGLTNIDTRVRMLNGEFNLESYTGKGTVASVEIPI